MMSVNIAIVKSLIWLVYGAIIQQKNMNGAMQMLKFNVLFVNVEFS
jgi:hypothetical protein